MRRDLDLRVGKVLKLRDDLKVGKAYAYDEFDNDFEIFTEDMEFQKGKTVMIFDIIYNENGSPAFICDHTECLYTLGMFDI